MHTYNATATVPVCQKCDTRVGRLLFDDDGREYRECECTKAARAKIRPHADSEYTVYQLQATAPDGEVMVLPTHALSYVSACELAGCEASELSGYKYWPEQFVISLVESTPE